MNVLLPTGKKKKVSNCVVNYVVVFIVIVHSKIKYLWGGVVKFGVQASLPALPAPHAPLHPYPHPCT